MKQFIRVLLAITTIAFLASLSACSSSGGGYRGNTTYGVGVGYGGYYGRRPWGHQPGYIGGGIGIDDGPVAAQMPEMGMPDFGGGGMDMGMGMDMGGFDF
jgi:hypothetical protein